jgi:hypothetical protein
MHYAAALNNFKGAKIGERQAMLETGKGNAVN